MNTYKALSRQLFTYKNFKLIPIRFEDRYLIMNWRNDQIYHLRQNEPITAESQDDYFNLVISELFTLDKPKQILFSLLKDNTCIGYGGLVHINWVDKNAEISFIMDTELEHFSFSSNWRVYLELIEKIGFEELGLLKLYTYAIDLRPKLYQILESSGYCKEAVLKNHISWKGRMVDVIIHSKFDQ